MSKPFWLLVEMDRHGDDQFTLFSTEADALVAAEKFAAQYGEKLQNWERFPKNPAAQDRFFVSGDDDGPKCRILKIEAEP